ncbi:MAG: DUF3307 domain-containing protein [Caldilineaceae bacterium]
MHLFITLLIAHLFADFPLQTNKLAKLKETHWVGVLLHVLVHMAVTMLLIRNSQTYWPLIGGIGVVHFVIDGLKLLCPAKKGVLYFLLDQLLHLLTLAIASYIAQQVWHTFHPGILPDQWLLLILFAALIPALMVLFWIWTNTLNQEYVAQISVLYWTKHQLLGLEQRIGLVIIGFVFAESVFYTLAGMVEQMWR